MWFPGSIRCISPSRAGASRIRTCGGRRCASAFASSCVATTPPKSAASVWRGGGFSVAVGAAVTAGNRDFDTIVAVDLSPSAPNGVVSPCGNCRQMMFEYCPDMRVIVNDENGKLIKVSVRDLLPFAYVDPAQRENA